ncbi:MAG: D-galactarate dehydratase [Rubellimicrobium sp.]|nr:D-galactarate dehydratase [Rubellimicrobium sp.]
MARCASIPIPALVAALLLLGGCAALSSPPGDAPAPVIDEAPEATLAAAPPPPPAARTAEEFDTTSAEQRAAATAAPAVAQEVRLGTTIASLGPPAEAGLWLRTGLVTGTVMGRVEYPATGKSVTLELRPSGGAAGGGSEISLAAMRLLEAPLTGLPELVVFRH